MCGIGSLMACSFSRRTIANGPMTTTLNLHNGTLTATVTAACKFSRFWYNNFAVWRATREEPRVVTRSPVAPVTWFSDSGGMRPRVANKATGSTQRQLQESPRLYRARDHCRYALKHYRAADQLAALFDFHVSVKNKNIRPISDRPFRFFLRRVRI